MISQQQPDDHRNNHVHTAYNIIRKHSSSDSMKTPSPNKLTPKSSTMAMQINTSTTSPILERHKQLEKTAQSMFSLRAVKSLRLQKWGDWIAYHDQSSKTVFWYNHKTNAGQWEQPQQVTLIQQNEVQKDIFEKVRNRNLSCALMCYAA